YRGRGAAVPERASHLAGRAQPSTLRGEDQARPPQRRVRLPRLYGQALRGPDQPDGLAAANPAEPEIGTPGPGTTTGDLAAVPRSPRRCRRARPEPDHPWLGQLLPRPVCGEDLRQAGEVAVRPGGALCQTPPPEQVTLLDCREVLGNAGPGEEG